jgi:TatD DNase family protein
VSLVDFHCHLDLYPDFETLVSESDRLEIFTLAVTTTPQAWSRNRLLASKSKYVRAALGLHPQLVADHWRQIDVWEKFLGETRYVGEVGLDAGSRYANSLDRQTEVFRRILQACAKAGGKILSIHSVRAAGLVLDMIEKELPRGRGTTVFHWFTGSIAEAKRAADLGCYFSVNGQMLLNERGKRLVSSLPQDRLLTETDGPFTSEGQNPAKPKNVERTVALLAKHRGWSAPQCGAIVLNNLKALTAS